MKTVWLKGDYVGTHDRQRQAKDAGCSCVIDFHFNSFTGGSAFGGECFYKSGCARSKELGGAVLQAFTDSGLPLRRQDTLQPAHGTAAAFIDYYHCPAILLEPLFLSTQKQAEWLHDEANATRLAESVAQRLRALLGKDEVVGLSVGHRYKTSVRDEGAPCVEGDSEADHAQSMAERVEAALLRQR